jgi:uncharacterized DUF497 family protein
MSGGLEFEWDEVKRRTNLEKHGIDFLDAVQIFVSDPLVFRSIQGAKRGLLRSRQFGACVGQRSTRCAPMWCGSYR